LYGGLRGENNPAINTSLLQLPVGQNGAPVSYTLNKGPYMEGSVGVGNVFKIFRIDMVERFNYLNNPDVPQFGVRVSASFDF
jgi:hypothetical protein